MAREPRILAGFVQGTLEAIDALDAELGARTREALKPEVLAQIDEAWAASWLPIECDAALTEALFEVAGERRACEVMRENLVATFRKPILETLVLASLRTFKASPAGLLRVAPRVWGLLLRDAGTMTVEAEEQSVRVRMTGLPPEVAQSRPYLLGIEASISAIFELVDVCGTSRLESHHGSEACFLVEWEPS